VPRETLRKRIKDWVLIHLAPLPGALFVKLLFATLRVRHLHRDIPEAIHREGRRYIMAFWHGTLLMMVKGYVGKRLTFLVSWHRDGELVSRVMGYFGMVPTRGSTTRGGLRALKQLIRRSREGYDIAFTPDGPRGPAEVVQLGMIQTARLSGLPIVPFGFAARKKKACGPGIPSRSPCPSHALFSAAVSLWRCPETPRMPRWRPCARRPRHG